MPVFSTLGSLTYTKVYLGEAYYWYIETTPGNQNTFEGFDINDSNLYIGGNIDYTGNTSAHNPNFINVIESNFSLPTDNYHAFYSSGSNRIGSISSVS
jgi:hypothetical protein